MALGPVRARVRVTDLGTGHVSLPSSAWWRESWHSARRRKKRREKREQDMEERDMEKKTFEQVSNRFFFIPVRYVNILK